MKTLARGTNRGRLSPARRRPATDDIRSLMDNLGFTLDEAAATAAAVQRQRFERTFFSKVRKP